jgi:hypothetical protein
LLRAEKGVSHLNKKTTAENPSTQRNALHNSVLANTFPYLKDFTLFLLRKSPKLGPKSWIPKQLDWWNEISHLGYGK